MPNATQQLLTESAPDLEPKLTMPSRTLDWGSGKARNLSAESIRFRNRANNV
jgi:hypothetical protein